MYKQDSSCGRPPAEVIANYVELINVLTLKIVLYLFNSNFCLLLDKVLGAEAVQNWEMCVCVLKYRN